ncbi:Uncharacterised protein [Chlamydia abortus]|nr:Uncharacterised protein [Chlamydia abortus]
MERIDQAFNGYNNNFKNTVSRIIEIPQEPVIILKNFIMIKSKAAKGSVIKANSPRKVIQSRY